MVTRRLPKDQQVAAVATEKQRKLIVKLALGTAAGLLIAAGLWIQPSMCVGAITDVLNKSDDEAVVTLESRNVPELVGGSERRLAGNTPKLIAAFAELSLAEITEIKRQTTLELEHFIHGALCFSFSGQCYFSSFLGGMSGNRGRCAQPCRRRHSYRQQQGYYYGR